MSDSYRGPEDGYDLMLDDAIDLLSLWDRQIWAAQERGTYVMDADLAALMGRRKRFEQPLTAAK
jgi:hypothetical protein